VLSLKGEVHDVENSELPVKVPLNSKINMEEILEKLTDYTLSLREDLANTKGANERSLLTKYLAAAAEMYALLYKHKNISAIEELVKEEMRSHGWSFISGEDGEKLVSNW
jgi:hypothetical protein